jgi:cytochrome c oxidase subunit 3
MPGFPFPPSYPNKGQLGMLVSLASIGAFFAALMLAFAIIVARQPSTVSVVLPGALWISTALIAVSSVTFESARRAIWRGRVDTYRSRLLATAVLGGLFLACQMISWEQLHAQGVSMMNNARGSAFYVFTGIHGAHLLGGIVALGYVLRRAAAISADSEQSLRRQRRMTGPVSLYWHSMGILWLFLFTLLLAWSN